MNALPYLLTTSLYLLLFYGCYWLLLRRNTFFGLNRAYLLASLILSLLLPIIKLPDTTEPLPIGPLILPTFVIGSAPTETNGLTVDQWFWLVYGLGVGVMLVRLSLNLWSLLRLIQSGLSEKRAHYTLVHLPNNSSPSFSFGTYLVLNLTDAITQPDALLRHEEAHIRQRHTIDILFLEILRVVFWFNPVLWFYKRALQEIHEFLADRAVLKTPQPDYPRQLVAYALNVPSTALITPFVSKSTLKQRISMLQKPASNRRALLGYVLTLPLAALLAMCTQSERDQPQTQVATEQAATRKAAKVNGEIFTVVENQPEFQGGMKKLGEYLSDNLKYPIAAHKAKAEGKVFVSFVVTKTGEIADVKILKGIGFGADEEAVRVVKDMPRWKPGSQSGQAVNVKYVMPINFQLKEKPLPHAKLSAFFSFPINDDDIRKSYTHFIVNGKEVAFDDFKKYNKADIVEASSSKQLIRLETN